MAVFSLCFLPPSELGRVFIPPCIHSTHVPPCEKKNVFLYSVAGTLLFLAAAFVFACLGAGAGNCAVRENMAAIRNTATEYVVELDGFLYRRECCDELQRLRSDYGSREALLGQARICGAMRAESTFSSTGTTSWGGEYARIAKMLMGAEADGKTAARYRHGGI